MSIYKQVIFFVFVCVACVLSFQNCGLDPEPESGQKQNSDEDEGNFEPFANISCQINHITMDADSIEFQVNDFEESIELEWDDTFDDVDDEDLQNILNHFYACTFIGDEDSTSQIYQFKIEKEDEDLQDVSSTHRDIFLSVNESTEDDGLLRLLSFTLVEKANAFSSCDLLESKLHKVGLDDDDDVILSTDPRLECEDAQFVEAEDEDDEDKYTLNCTYQTDQTGCIFHIALWSYDSKYRIASQRNFIQLRIE